MYDKVENRLPRYNRCLSERESILLAIELGWYVEPGVLERLALPDKKRMTVIDGQRLSPVQNIKEIEYSGMVYDLQIEGTPYYVADDVLVHNSEYARRFTPRNRTGIEQYNPLRNRMPGWLPGPNYFVNFRIGDPYVLLERGEQRLPGAGFESLYDVRRTFPAAASMMGKPIRSIVEQMLGLSSPMEVYEQEIVDRGTDIHKRVQMNLATQNALHSAEVRIFNPYTNYGGYVDAIIKSPQGPHPLEIKTVSSERFSELSGPMPDHQSQLNVYMRELGVHTGSLLYISRDDPTLTAVFPVRYSESRYQRDVARLETARNIAVEWVMAGGERGPGAGYSRLDRYRILSSTAPWSEQYKSTRNDLRKMAAAGLLDDRQKNEIAKIERQRKSIMRKYDFYPYRYRGNIISPQTDYMVMSEDKYIKPAAQYSVAERILGAVWETFTHMRTPLHVKFWSQETPLEHYERTRIYNSEQKFWQSPMKHFIEPYVRSTLSQTDPVGGMIAGYQGGWIFGGPQLAFLSGTAAAVYGAIHGAYRRVTGTKYIPNQVKGQRNINEYFKFATSRLFT